MITQAAIRIDGIIVPGLCPPWYIRPKDFLCPRIIEQTSATMSSFDKEIPDATGVRPTDPDTETQWTSQEIGSTAEMNTHNVELAAMPDNTFEIYKKGKSTITVTIDPLIKKDIRFKWIYELSGVETPGVDINAGYDDAGIGFTDTVDDASPAFA